MLTELLVAAGIMLGLWAVSCLLMMLFAHRLPNGLLKQVAEFLPSCVTAARTLRKHPDVPRRAKVALLVAVLWVVSPIDLLPEFLPVMVRSTMSSRWCCCCGIRTQHPARHAPGRLA